MHAVSGRRIILLVIAVIDMPLTTVIAEVDNLSFSKMPVYF